MLTLGLLALLALYLWYFAAHAQALLAFPYPLDYGEGPLLLQARLLAGGTGIAGLYGDPAQPPYTVVNYPPLYLLLTEVLARLTGDLLLAGRLLSLLAAFACVAALAVLLHHNTSAEPDAASIVLTLLPSLAFLALPVVRQWSALMRVDLLGVALGLWGLVALVGLDQRPGDRETGRPGDRQEGIRALEWLKVSCLLSLVSCLLLACLYTKPSLLAAPAAACLWLVVRRPRRGLLLVALLGVGGGAIFALLQIATGGRFALHTLAANANRWQPALAWQFWREQLTLLWPLFLATSVGAVLLLRSRYGLGSFLPRRHAASKEAPAVPLRLRGMIWRLLGSDAALPVLYMLIGALGALGVGKVGAYANYFLELYIGMLWVVGLLLVQLGQYTQPAEYSVPPRLGGEKPLAQVSHGVLGDARRPLLLALLLLALLAALARYSPLWDPLQPRQAGILGPNPPRLVVGSYGLWDDQRRERQLLAAFAAWQQAINAAAQAERGPLFTDTPGLLVAAGVAPRLQAFEHRQLLDQGLWDQGELLRQLANGELSLAIVDYLGNWLSPEMVALLRQRYALDGSIGVFSLYRPLALGPRVELPRNEDAGLQLVGYRLAAPFGQAAYSPGETLTLALEWQRVGELRAASEVVVELRGPDGTLVTQAMPLLYGAVTDLDWPEGVVLQHVQPLTLPADAPPQQYTILASLRSPGDEQQSAPQEIARVQVGPQVGRVFEHGIYVPAPILMAWQQLGGESHQGPGLPLMPAVPFERATLQCFERACLDADSAGVTRRPLGRIIGLDAPIWPAVALADEASVSGAGGIGLAAPFAPLWHKLGGEEGPGLPVTPPLDRLGFTVQYTDYARLERAADGSFSLGRLGDDYLRLPPGVPYPWPAQAMASVP